MLSCKKIILFFGGMLIAAAPLAQHPNYNRIDSLKKILPAKQGIEIIDCLNAIAEENWWPLTTASDTISGFASLALKEAVSIHYYSGIAKATMLMGVAGIFGKNLTCGEKYLRESLSMYEALHSDYGLGWCYVWLGQAFYQHDRSEEALACQRKSLIYFEKLGDWEGEVKAWAWIGMT